MTNPDNLPDLLPEITSIDIEIPKQIAISVDDTEPTVNKVDLDGVNMVLTVLYHNIANARTIGTFSRMANDMIKLVQHRRSILGHSYGTKDSSRKDNFVYPID